MIQSNRDAPDSKMEETLKQIEHDGYKQSKNFNINKLLTDPLLQNKYFLKISLLQTSFALKIEENINDDIQKSYDTLHKIQGEILFP